MRAKTEVKAQCPYGRRSWGGPGWGARKGAEGEGRRGQCLCKEEIPHPRIRTHTHTHRRHMSIPVRESQLQPMDHIWLTEVLLFCCFWSVHLFLKWLPIYKKQKILHFKLWIPGFSRKMEDSGQRRLSFPHNPPQLERMASSLRESQCCPHSQLPPQAPSSPGAQNS